MKRILLKSISESKVTYIVPIIVGISLIAFPYYPTAQYAIQKVVSQSVPLKQAIPERLQLPDTSVLPTEGNWLVLPSIGVKQEILEGPGLDILDSKEGVWHQIGPLEGNMVLAGHRFQYLPPNAHTFYNLNKVTMGDAIDLVWQGKAWRYVVTGQKYVTPDQVEILNPSENPILTLYTCNDWTLSKRLVVTAKQLKL